MLRCVEIRVPRHAAQQQLTYDGHHVLKTSKQTNKNQPFNVWRIHAVNAKMGKKNLTTWRWLDSNIIHSYSGRFFYFSSLFFHNLVCLKKKYCRFYIIFSPRKIFLGNLHAACTRNSMNAKQMINTLRCGFWIACISCPCPSDMTILLQSGVVSMCFKELLKKCGLLSFRYQSSLMFLDFIGG